MAYASPFISSTKREDAMHPRLHHCNTKRPHAALGGNHPLPDSTETPSEAAASTRNPWLSAIRYERV